MKEKILKGSQKIMFSAPHCVNHFRNGKTKAKEVNTDTIVVELNKRKDVPAIYKIDSLNEDANWDLNSSYKEACKKYVLENNVKFFIDVHGMDYRRKEDICIGTANGKNLKNYASTTNILKDVFLKYGYKIVTIDTPFSADNPRCISRFISKECNIDAVQIEINNRYRFPEAKEYNLENLILCFEEIIQMINTSFDNL